MNSEYLKYLRSKKWQHKKQDFRASKLFKNGCHVCGREKVDIHHKSYKRLGQERLTDLVALCRTCHDAVHQMVKEHSNISKYNFWSCVKKYKKTYLGLLNPQRSH